MLTQERQQKALAEYDKIKWSEEAQERLLEARQKEYNLQRQKTQMLEGKLCTTIKDDRAGD